MITLIGFLSSAFLVISYLLFASNKISNKLYYNLNIIGCVCAMVYALFLTAMPMFITNLIFFIISIFGLKNLKIKTKDKKDPLDGSGYHV